MRVLVTGATGFTGGVLAEKLFQLGHQVRVLVRDRSRISSPSRDYFDVIESDITQLDGLKLAVRDIDLVFHIAAIYRQAGVPDQRYWEVNVEASENLLQLAHLAGAKRFVHCSTVGVHGNIEEPPADETYRFSPGDIYQITKLAAEKNVLNYHLKTGFPISVIRPGAIYGAGDMRLLKLFKLAAKNITPVLGDGNIYYNMVYVNDLADIFILAGERDEAIGEVFLGAGPENLQLNDILDKISAILSKPSRKIHLPVKPFQLAGTLCEKVCIPLGIEPPIYRRRIDFFTKSRSFSIDKSRRLLGYNPQFDYTRGLALAAEWYREHKLL